MPVSGDAMPASMRSSSPQTLRFVAPSSTSPTRTSLFSGSLSLTRTVRSLLRPSAPSAFAVRTRDVMVTPAPQRMAAGRRR